MIVTGFHRLRPFRIAAPLLVITVLWLLSKGRVEPGWQAWPIAVPQALSQIFALWAVVLFALALVISARSRLVEQIYGGLDRSYRTHAALANARSATIPGR